ncbi:hypothetical protein [Litorimonas sp. WD9-15]|uniref:hypothetical protein n=1 Tax=Litorimonas sp. WD9-15 TaxID=3418716 RepID=UPI003D01938D
MPSPRFLHHATAQVSDDVDVILLRLSCSDFPDWSDLTDEDVEDFPLDWDPGTMYFVSNTEAITSRGHTYIPWMFELTPPSQGSGPSGSTLRFENIDRRIGDAIKLLPSSAEIFVAAEMVLAETPDIIEQNFTRFKLTVIQLQQLTIEASLAPPNDALEPFCSFIYEPAFTPGVFPQ